MFLYVHVDVMFKAIEQAMYKIAWPGGTTPGRFVHRPGCWLLTSISVFPSLIRQFAPMPKKQAFFWLRDDESF